MYITCPECFTRYIVKAQSIGANGRKVKCAKCGHQWFQAAASDEEAQRIQKEIADKIEQAVDTKLADELVKEKKLPVALDDDEDDNPDHRVPLSLRLVTWILLCITPITIGVFYKDYIITLLPESEPIYGMVGLGYKEGIRLYNVSTKEAPLKEEMVTWVQGLIVNEAEETRYMKRLRVRFLDMDHKLLGQEYFPSHQEVKAGQEIPFQVPLPKMPEGVAYMVVDVATPFELLLR
jgi:predicted Zn finger-like uncharacterized protein